MLTNPFEKFERKRFMYYSKDLSIISLNHALFSQMILEDWERIRNQMNEDLENYYKELGGIWYTDVFCEQILAHIIIWEIILQVQWLWIKPSVKLTVKDAWTVFDIMLNGGRKLLHLEFHKVPKEPSTWITFLKYVTRNNLVVKFDKICYW